MEDNALIRFLTRVELRWFFYFTALILTVFAYFQEPLRYSNAEGITGLTLSWETYILSMINLVNYFITLFGLWLTIPFLFGMPNYWFIALFIFLMALFTEIFINTKDYVNVDNNIFQPPPDNFYPKKYRLIIHYFILIFDVLIFLQLFLATNDISINAKTFLDKYLLGRFGGWVKGNRINFLASWLATVGILFDIYNIRNQTYFYPCKYKLPITWDF